MDINKLKSGYVKELAADGKRIDERGLLDYREIRVTKGFIPNSEGSALVEIGKTKVLAGIKFGVMEPFPDRPEEGVLITNAEFSLLANPEFKPGPPDENSIELARVVDRGIRAAECVDLKKLYLEEGKVLGLFLDIYVLDDNGNRTDAAGLAAMAALHDCKIPEYKDGALNREKMAKIKLENEALIMTFEKIGERHFVDCDNVEELASSGRLTIGVTPKEEFCCFQKSGEAGFTKKEIMELCDTAVKKSKELFKLAKK